MITIFDALTLNEVRRMDINNNNTNSEIESANKLEYSAYSLNQIICTTLTNKLLKFDCKTGRLVSTIGNIHRTITDCLTVSNDGRFLVTSGDNCIKVWDYEMRFEKNFQTFIGHSASISRVLFSPDNSTLISVGDSIVFWNFLAVKSEEDYRPEKTTTKVNAVSNSAMPQGRHLEEMRLIQPIAVVREIISNPKNPNEINDYNHLKIFNRDDFDDQLNSNWPMCNASFERPRTPPVACPDNLHIETIAVNCEIEDTFLNSEITFLESNLSSCSQSEQNLKKVFKSAQFR
jgi:WD40 repeat protein